ncbi:hypothetical protein NDU88_007035 [Pleurodeles waltl]|uniref:Uncharacterized protein n=1 Tax=Pleurodeles waltl TaxID=8319 RepID=A0AAV7SR96_PLEWA|nr:hypothetical protein NDU88_007035 [Pleurodeles waltl]
MRRNAEYQLLACHKHKLQRPTRSTGCCAASRPGKDGRPADTCRTDPPGRHVRRIRSGAWRRQGPPQAHRQVGAARLHESATKAGPGDFEGSAGASSMGRI